MAGVNSLFSLMRPNQWYKNLVVFLALLFSSNLANISLLYISFIAFLSLCFVSSANYIVNDIFDRDSDKRHPEKRHRLIASGKLSGMKASFFAIFLIVLSFALSPNFLFLLSVIAIFILTFAYSAFFKQVVFLDILFIATNFVLRAVAGALAINVWISPFLVLLPFLLSIFLSAGKRYSDFLLIKKSKYSQGSLRIIIYSSFALSILSLLIYSVFTDFWMLLTVPIAFIAMLQYSRLIFKGSRIARHPHLLFGDVFFLFLLFLFVFISFFAVYF